MRYVDELTDAIRHQLSLAVSAKDLLGYALRQRLREGYTARDFRADALAGLVVGVVALPLSMALAVAVSLPPQHGLYTAIVAGVLCALLGGSRLQITGPTAAFVVVLIPIVQKFGLGGLLLAGMMAGILLVLMGIARMGKLMTFVPHPVTTGFTTGIALVIALLQLKDAFGLQLPRTEGTVEYVGSVVEHIGAINPWEVGVTVTTVALLILVPRITRRIPAPLIVLTVVAAGAALLAHYVPGFSVATIGSKYQTVVDGEIVRGIPPLPPMPMVPWGDSGFNLSYATIRELLPAAFAIAMLGAIESLMSAVIADGMSGTKHDPNAELIALGIGNIVCPFFGGIPATGALARTATNIRAGARSPISSIVHALFVLTCTIALAPLVAYLPMAAMAGLLLIVARNMSELRHFLKLLRVAPKSDVGVLLTCFGLTVLFDMVIAVTVGVVLAALLFMRRMAVLTKVSLEEHSPSFEMPAGVKLYEIAGPLFFGAAKTAMATLDTVDRDARTVILSMRSVPTIDATGLVAFETVLDRLQRSRRKVIIAGLQPEVMRLLDRAGIRRRPGQLAFAPDVETAVSMAIVHEARGAVPPPSELTSARSA